MESLKSVVEKNCTEGLCSEGLTVKGNYTQLHSCSYFNFSWLDLTFKNPMRDIYLNEQISHQWSRTFAIFLSAVLLIRGPRKYTKLTRYAVFPSITCDEIQWHTILLKQVFFRHTLFAVSLFAVVIYNELREPPVVFYGPGHLPLIFSVFRFSNP